MSLINSLGKHPASNTSCLDGEAVTSLAAPSLASPRPDPPQEPGAGPGHARLRVCVGRAWGLHPQRCCIAAVGFGLVLCPGGEEVLCPGCVSLGTAHTTAVCIPTESQALPCWRTAFHFSCFTRAMFGSNGSCRVGGGQC